MGYGGAIHTLKNMVLRTDKSLGERVVHALDEVESEIVAYRSLNPSQSEIADLDIVQQMVAAYRERVTKALQMIKTGATPAEIDRVIKYDDGPALAAFDRLKAAISAERTHARGAVEGAVAAATNFTRLTAATAILALAFFAFALILFIRTRVMGPLTSLVAHMNRIGKGDLSTRIQLARRDEVGALAAAMNDMTVSLATLTSHAHEASLQLSSLANETLAATRQQASSVEEQFASVQEVTATVDEIVRSGEQMAARAREVLHQARATVEKGENGLGSVKAMAAAMDAIRRQTEVVAGNSVTLSEQTQTIGEIITTVTDIAQRSELLALNAAIEAAAAGDHGRSFSVVAEEIKAMAEQSKSATKQISEILGTIHDGINTSVMMAEESVKRVESGRLRSEEALGAIGDMTESIGQSISAFELSVTATNQQRIGLDQVAMALAQIRQGGEQTASGTRQIETAVNEITALSSQLTHSIKGRAA